MILLFITWLIDGFLMSLIYTLVATIFHKNVLLDWIILGYITTTVFMLVGISKIGSYFLRLYLGYRDAINRERQRVNPLLQDVLNCTNQVYSTSYQIDKIKIMVLDSKVPDSTAISVNTIVLTDGLLKNIDDKELTAVLAYEIGHLHNRDSLILSAVIFGTIGRRVIAGVYSWYKLCYDFITAKVRQFGNKGLHLIPLLAIIPLIIFLPIVVLNWLVKQLFDIGLYIINRRYVYKADNFVKTLNYQDGLVSYLETNQEIKPIDKSVMGRIFAAHPPAMKRIGRLEGVPN